VTHRCLPDNTILHRKFTVRFPNAPATVSPLDRPIRVLGQGLLGFRASAIVIPATAIRAHGKGFTCFRYRESYATTWHTTPHAFGESGTGKENRTSHLLLPKNTNSSYKHTTTQQRSLVQHLSFAFRLQIVAFYAFSSATAHIFDTVSCWTGVSA
jgi:hypothetical protein